MSPEKINQLKAKAVEFFKDLAKSPRPVSREALSQWVDRYKQLTDGLDKASESVGGEDSLKIAMQTQLKDALKGALTLVVDDFFQDLKKGSPISREAMSRQKELVDSLDQASDALGDPLFKTKTWTEVQSLKDQRIYEAKIILRIAGCVFVSRRTFQTDDPSTLDAIKLGLDRLEFPERWTHEFLPPKGKK